MTLVTKLIYRVRINMDICPKILAAIAGSFLSLVTVNLVNVKEAQAGTFTFTKIVDDRNSEGLLNIGGGPINDNGTVAFVASTPSAASGLSSTGIFTSNGGQITTVVNPNPGIRVNGLGINNSGTVAFVNFGNFPEEGLFLSSGGNVVTVATTRRDGLFEGNLSPNLLNNNGTLVFRLLRGIGSPVSSPVIVTGNGGPFTTVVDTSGPFSFFDQSPAINDNNVVAFIASLKDGGQGVFTIKDGSIRTIADNSSLSRSGFSEVDINNRETVAFSASLNNGGEGIFIGNGETITTVADTSGSFSRLYRPAINDNNQVAFNARFRDGAQNVFADGIFTGLDPVTDKVIAIGDSVLDGTVTNLFFSGGLNNSGQISFYAELKDNNGNTIRGVFRADPVSKSIPESVSTLGLLAFGTLTTGLALKGKLKQKSTVEEMF